MVETNVLLKQYGLNNVTLENQSGHGVSIDIEWSQIDKSLFGCKESYKQCEYKVMGTDKRVIVFIANACGSPPNTIHTSGYHGLLHCGYIYEEKDGLNAIFFVIHPSDWAPYQHRFRESALTGLVNSAINSGASNAGGVLAGVAVGMFFGPVGAVIGAGVGAIGSTVGSSWAKSVLGDYLRFIG
ncbi:hypothetical protein ABK040_015201 [Willaertia magna]